MKFHINLSLFYSVALLCCLMWLASSSAMSCDSCGRECTSSCGTRHFRTCCFNYLRKRSVSSEVMSDDGIYVSPDASKLPNWVRDAPDMENVIRHAITMEKIANSRKKHLNDNFADYP